MADNMTCGNSTISLIGTFSGFVSQRVPPGGTVAADSTCTATGAEHCWHLAAWQHTVTNHRDDTCCHCGCSCCVSLPAPQAPPGHGPYYPFGAGSAVVTATITTCPVCHQPKAVAPGSSVAPCRCGAGYTTCAVQV